MKCYTFSFMLGIGKAKKLSVKCMGGGERKQGSMLASIVLH